MAFIGDGGDSSLFSVRPPRAPGQFAHPLRRRPMARPGVSRLHPVLRKMMRARQGGGEQTFQDFLEQERQLGQPPQPAPNAEDARPQMPDWFLANMPGNDPSGMYGNQWGSAMEGAADNGGTQQLLQRLMMRRSSAQEQQPGPMGDVRAELFDRFHTAAPQQPALTSRRALRRHVQQASQRRRVPGAPPLLPIRRRPY